MSLVISPNDFESAAAGIVERFRHLWVVRDAELIRQIVDPAGVSYWSGTGEVSGIDYPERWKAVVNIPGIQLDFEITGSAAQKPFLYISWRARASAGADKVEWDGVDRFRLKGERADEVYVVFDTAPIRALLQRLSAPRQ